MKGEKISVIVPIYKVEAYLPKCLDSILGQTHQNLEIILVDDGSPDNCGRICDDYATRDDRIKVIHQKNGGVAAARNAGLDTATGDWIAWVDPDDWIEKDMLQYLLDGALTSQADLAICGMRKMGSHAPIVFQYKEDRVLIPEQALQELLENKNMTLSCCDKLAKRELWEGIRFSNLKIGEDLLAIGRILDRANRIVCLSEIKYNYLTRAESALTDGSIESRLDCWRAAIQQYEELSPKWPKLKSILAGRSAAAAIGVWAAYLDAPKEKQRKLFPEIEKIAEFCRNHRRDALAHIELGLSGKIALLVTPYPKWWAFRIAQMAGWLYKVKHKRAL